MYWEEIGNRKIEVSDIPDNYMFMDPELVDELFRKVDALVFPDQ